MDELYSMNRTQQSAESVALYEQTKCNNSFESVSGTISEYAPYGLHDHPTVILSTRQQQDVQTSVNMLTCLQLTMLKC